MANELPEGLQYDWEVVPKLNPKGYAEVRTADGKWLFHGPIKEVKVRSEDDVVELHFIWLASVGLCELGVPKGHWVATPERNPLTFPNLMMPFLVEETPEKGPRLRFGLNILYLEEVTGVDPAEVEGLVIPT